MPSVNGNGHASNSFVWTEWTNGTGWKSQGFVFVMGMLNGAFAVGAPDICSHLAEEIPRLAPLISGCGKKLTGQTEQQHTKSHLGAIYRRLHHGFRLPRSNILWHHRSDAITRSDNLSVYPLAKIYRQATGTSAGAVGLLVVACIPTFIASLAP
ncbi:hypothetical protein MRB53_037207 [Persea americana]|nr:hypothetical protein MRB53_037207 [Persea americana]